MRPVGAQEAVRVEDVLDDVDAGGDQSDDVGKSHRGSVTEDVISLTDGQAGDAQDDSEDVLGEPSVADGSGDVTEAVKSRREEHGGQEGQ